MDDCYTYTFWDGDSPIYVGKGTGKRAFEHLARKDMHPFVQKLQKMKRNGVKPIIRAITGLTEDRAFMAEKLLIGVLGRKDLGTGTLLNLTPGGESGPKLIGDLNPMKDSVIVAKCVATRRANGGYAATKETKKKISDTLKAKGIKPPSRKGTGDQQRGAANPHYGKHHSEEWKSMMSSLMKGKKGKPATEETKKKVSEAMKASWATRKEHTGSNTSSLCDVI